MWKGREYEKGQEDEHLGAHFSAAREMLLVGMVGPCFLVRGKSPERLLKLYCSPLVQSSNSKQIHMGEVLSTKENKMPGRLMLWTLWLYRQVLIYLLSVWPEISGTGFYRRLEEACRAWGLNKWTILFNTYKKHVFDFVGLWLMLPILNLCFSDNWHQYMAPFFF